MSFSSFFSGKGGEGQLSVKGKQEKEKFVDTLDILEEQCLSLSLPSYKPALKACLRSQNFEFFKSF